MQIRVKSLQGDEYVVEVQNEQSVLQLKTTISEKANGLPTNKLKLVYKGRTMQDSSPVSEYKLEHDCKVHLILQKDPIEQSNTTNNHNQNASSNRLQALSNDQLNDASKSSSSPSSSNSVGQHQTHLHQPHHNATNKEQSRFEKILRERLARHFSPSAVEQIMCNLQNEIDADINSSSLDDLERLAKQKLNISNE